MTDSRQQLHEHMRTIRHHLPQLLLLLALAFAAYWEVLTHSFLVNWDDPAYITQNPAIRGFSLENLKLAFSGYFVGNYAPVQIVSYMLDYTLWGGNPFGYLLANVFYHCLSGILLYGLLARRGFQPWVAFFGTAVFLVHPVQVESVAWLSQRKNLLAMLMYLGAFHGYLNYRERKGRPLVWYVLSVVLFILALLAKSVAVIFPIMLILYDLLIAPVRRHFREHLDKIPYLAAAGIVGLVAMVSQDVEHGGGRVEYPPNALMVLPLTMLPVLVSYVRLLFWPAPSQLSVMYFPPMKSSFDAAVAAALVLVVVLIAAGLYLYRASKPGLFWYLLFFLGLVPVSQIVPLITLMNDRYLYFPMLGVAGCAAYLVTTVWEHLERLSMRRWFVTVAAGIVIVLAVFTHLRVAVWRNSISLFSDLAAKYPEKSASWARLAEGYIAAGDLSIAQHYYEKAISLGPVDNDGLYNLVQIYFEKGMYSKAYEQVWMILLRGDQANRGMLLLGEYYYRTGDFSEAKEKLLQFLSESPSSSHGLYLLGQTYLMTGHNEQAIENYQKALTADGNRDGAMLAAGGNHAAMLYSLACAELRLGHQEQASAALQASFERGLVFKEFQGSDRCLQDMQTDPRIWEIIRLHSRE